MQATVNSQNGENVVQEVVDMIADYKKNANVLTKMLADVEKQRTQIINHIEELQHTKKLDKYVALRLEDKLSRPYAMAFLEF